jgi:hypothetical protein
MPTTKKAASYWKVLTRNQSYREEEGRATTSMVLPLKGTRSERNGPRRYKHQCPTRSNEEGVMFRMQITRTHQHQLPQETEKQLESTSSIPKEDERTGTCCSHKEVHSAVRRKRKRTVLRGSRERGFLNWKVGSTSTLPMINIFSVNAYVS